jgi:hypothetical protein
MPLGAWKPSLFGCNILDDLESFRGPNGCLRERTATALRKGTARERKHVGGNFWGRESSVRGVADGAWHRQAASGEWPAGVASGGVADGKGGCQPQERESLRERDPRRSLTYCSGRGGPSSRPLHTLWKTSSTVIAAIRPARGFAEAL